MATFRASLLVCLVCITRGTEAGAVSMLVGASRRTEADKVFSLIAINETFTATLNFLFPHILPIAEPTVPSSGCSPVTGGDGVQLCGLWDHLQQWNAFPLVRPNAFSSLLSPTRRRPRLSGETPTARLCPSASQCGRPTQRGDGRTISTFCLSSRWPCPLSPSCLQEHLLASCLADVHAWRRLLPREEYQPGCLLRLCIGARRRLEFSLRGTQNEKRHAIHAAQLCASRRQLLTRPRCSSITRRRPPTAPSPSPPRTWTAQTSGS